MHSSHEATVLTSAHPIVAQPPTFYTMSAHNPMQATHTTATTTNYKPPDPPTALIDPNLPQAFCLRWNNYQSNLTSVFEQLLHNEQFVDVTLSCDNISIKAHKVVLSACSPYFTSLFNENPCKHPIIIMRDIKFTELKAIVEFMYRGEINVSQDQIGPLLRIAELLKIRGLADVSTDQKVEVETTTTTTTTTLPENTSYVVDQHQVLELTKPTEEVAMVTADWNANVPAEQNVNAVSTPISVPSAPAQPTAMPVIPVTIAPGTLGAGHGQVYVVQEINLKPVVEEAPPAPVETSPVVVKTPSKSNATKPHRKRKLNALLAMPVTPEEAALLSPSGSSEKSAKRAASASKKESPTVKSERSEVFHELVIDEEMKANQSTSEIQALDESTASSTALASSSMSKDDETTYDSEDQSSEKLDEKAFSSYLRLKAPTWSQVQLREAIDAVISQKLRFTQASSKYNIPKGTLYDNILGKANRMLVLEESGLDANAEKAVLEFCCDVSVSPYNRRTRKPLAKILEFVQTLSDALSGGKCTVHFSDKFGFRWWWAFCKKYSIVSLHYENHSKAEQTK